MTAKWGELDMQSINSKAGGRVRYFAAFIAASAAFAGLSTCSYAAAEYACADGRFWTEPWMPHSGVCLFQDAIAQS
jgi:hypothetical protein